MPAAMHLTVLVSLFAVTLCEDTTTSSTAKLTKEIATSAARHTSLAAKTTSLFSVPTQQPPTTTHQITTAVTSKNISSLPPPLTSPQTPNRTEETHPSVTPPQTTTTNQTSNETVFHGSTLPPATESPNITATTTVHITSPGLSHEWEKGDLAANPGLVAILCIFCIIFALVLVVVSVKCIRSQRSNFVRLEDVPMDKVNEGSPFAQYSK